MIVIDIQNDYFPGGRFTLENSETALANALDAIAQAKQAGDVVVGIQNKSPSYWLHLRIEVYLELNR